MIVAPVKRLCPSVSVITDPDQEKVYWSILQSYWNLPSSVKHFPAANPVSIARHNLGHIRENDCMVALKTDGVRHLLLMTVCPRTNEPVSLMIDRTRKMYEVEIWASEEYFHLGTLIDGELVWNVEERETIDFVAFDVMRVKGVTCTAMPYRDRLQVLHNTILVTNQPLTDDLLADEDKIVASGNLHNLRIVSKKCVRKEQIRELWHTRSAHMHRNDGLILTMNAAPVETGTAVHTFKWKPTHSVDVRIHFQNGTFQVYGNHNNSDKLVLLHRFKDRVFELRENRLLHVLQRRLPTLVECVLDVSDPHSIALIPERERTDKKSPNTVYVIEATVVNADENITIEELHATVAQTTSSSF